ncbi:MAG: 3-dehydroquinate synthase [Spirochaetia bacterium]|nr:3-dehydroquinate synthase [Spirochaetia bacterium]
MEIHCRIGDKRTTVRFFDRISQLPSVKDNTLVVFDEFTAELYPLKPENYIIIKRGETYKTLAVAETILEKAVSSGLGRDACFTAVGGGVVCDMTAFAAAVYMRGVEVSLIPTTLLSMVDASLGGKTGVDFLSYKNLIGAFYPAAEVFICPEFVLTLSDHEYFNGLAEVIKHGLLSGGELFRKITEKRALITSRNMDMVNSLVYESLLVKKEYVEADPYEKTGLRACLNFGHTFGHAFETVNGLQNSSHGEAVAWGMAKALQAGKTAGITDAGYVDQVLEILAACNYPIDRKISDFTTFYKALMHDKKNTSKKIRFVLQKKLAATYIGELPEQIIRTVVTS